MMICLITVAVLAVANLIATVRVYQRQNEACKNIMDELAESETRVTARINGFLQVFQKSREL